MPSLTSDEALDKLVRGNQRYVSMKALHPRQNQVQREALLDGQNPFAAILSCSDSRVPSELIFDQGLGDLFIVRTAGHVIDDLIIGSIEFAVHVLHVPLVMVMGHAHCGAVSSTLSRKVLPGFISLIESTLQPALDAVQDEAGDPLTNAIHANARYTARRLTQESTILNDAVRAGELKIVPAYFDLKTSNVSLLDR